MYPVTAIILAGGKSSRMKTEKGLLPFRGKAMIAHVIAAAVESNVAGVLITSANPAYDQFGYACIADEMKDMGPLGGILTGLTRSGTQKNLVLGCDMPFLPARLLRQLIAAAGDEAVLLTTHRGMAEPLCAVYDKSCLAHFGQCLQEGRLKITDALEGLKVKSISFDTENWLPPDAFANVNTETDVKNFEPIKTLH